MTGTPIYIEDDNPSYNWAITASTQPWCSGSGTWSDPYIIENVTIDGQNIISTLIQIEHSSVYFIIKNCILYGSGSAGNALYLAVVDNGIIMNNSIYDSGDGIDLINSNNNTIRNNKIYNNNKNGIIINSWVYGGDKNRIIENEIYNNNEYGIYFDGDPSYIMKDNIISNNNISFNGIDGIRLFYSDYNIINSNNIFNNTEDGIYIFRSYNNRIQDNSIYNNTDQGIYLATCEQTTIEDNLIAGNEYGITAIAGSGDDCRYNEIVENVIINNNLYGIYLDSESSNNDIYYNNFSDNIINALDDGANNNWDNDGIGNLWSDYTTKYPLAINDGFVWNISYEIGGSASSQDNYPLCSSKPILRFEISSNNLNTTTPLETDKGLEITCRFLRWYNLDWVYLSENSNGTFVNQSMSQLTNGDWIYIVNISGLNAGDILMFSFYVKYNPIVHFDNSGLNYSIRIGAKVIVGIAGDDDDDDEALLESISGYDTLIMSGCMLGIVTILIIIKKVKTNIRIRE